jgi:hypothetical protein
MLRVKVTLLHSIFNIQPFWYKGLRKYQCRTSIHCGEVQIRPVCGVIWFRTDWIARVWSITGTVWFIRHPWPHIKSVNFSNTLSWQFFHVLLWHTKSLPIKNVPTFQLSEHSTNTLIRGLYLWLIFRMQHIVLLICHFCVEWCHL